MGDRSQPNGPPLRPLGTQPRTQHQDPTRIPPCRSSAASPSSPSSRRSCAVSRTASAGPARRATSPGSAPSTTPTPRPAQTAPGPARRTSRTRPTTDRPGRADRRAREARAEPEKPTEPELVPGPALLAPGDSGDDVRDLQARLAQIDWFNADVTGYYGDVTTEAVRGFQAKREIPVTGEVDQRTLDRLHAMTTEPTQAELTNQTTTNTPGALDPRCLEGRVICIDKSSSTLRWVVDGEGAEDHGRPVRRVGDPDPRGRVQRLPQEPRPRVEPLRHVRCRSRCSSPAARPCTTRPTSRRSATTAPPTAASTPRLRRRSPGSTTRSQVGDKVIVYWS